MKKRLIITFLLILIIFLMIAVALIAPVVVKKRISAGLGPEFSVREIKFNLFNISVYDFGGRVPISGDAVVIFKIPFMDIVPSWSNILRRDIVFSTVYIKKPDVKISKSEPHDVTRRDKEEKADVKYNMRFNTIQVENALIGIDLIKSEPPVIFEKGKIVVKGLKYPSVDKFDFRIQGMIREGGSVDIDGKWSDSEKILDFSLRLDAIPFDRMRAYLRDVERKGIRWKMMDVDAKGELKGDNIVLMGKATLYDLKYSSNGLSGNVQGIPAGMLVAFLKDKKGRLSFNFSLSGNIKNPHFSIQESIGEMFFRAIAEKMDIKKSIGESQEVIEEKGKEVLEKGVKAFEGFKEGIKGLWEKKRD